MKPEQSSYLARDSTALVRCLGCVLELPIWPDEARRRSLPGHLARLLVFPRWERCPSDGDAWTALATWLYNSKDPAEILAAWLVAPYASKITTEKTLREAGLLSHVMPADGEVVVKCESASAAYSLITAIESEVTVFAFGMSEKALLETINEVNTYAADYASIEVPLASQVSRHGAFVFRNADHVSLEMIGIEEFVRARGLKLIGQCYE